MRIVGSLSLILLLTACKQTSSRPIASSNTTPHPVAVPARMEWNVDTAGDAYQLSLKENQLSFCDDRGPHLLSLETGQQTSSTRKCIKPAYLHGTWTGCDDEALKIQVYSPQDQSNDSLSFGKTFYDLKGRADDCDNDGTIAVFGTGEQIVLVDGQTERSAILSNNPGPPVAIGSGWVAWRPGVEHKIHLIRQSTAVWQTPK